MNALILIVEDNRLNMELAADLLEASGFRVIQGATAEEGLRLAGERLPDLILMDLSLPGMDGLAATRVLRQDAILRQIPVIAVTAHAMRGDEEIAMASGCDGYLSKPIDTRTFVSKVAAFIGCRESSPGQSTLAPR